MEYKITKEIRGLIEKIMARDIELRMLKEEKKGLIITKDIVLEIIKDLTGEKNNDEDYNKKMSNCCDDLLLNGFCKNCKEHSISQYEYKKNPME